MTHHHMVTVTVLLAAAWLVHLMWTLAREAHAAHSLETTHLPDEKRLP